MSVIVDCIRKCNQIGLQTVRSFAYSAGFFSFAEIFVAKRQLLFSVGRFESRDLVFVSQSDCDIV